MSTVHTRGKTPHRRGRGSDGRGRGLLPRKPRAVIEIPTQESIQSNETSRKVWLPKSARALDMRLSAPQGAIASQSTAPIMALSGEDSVERPTLPVHRISAYSTLGELGKGQFGVVSQAVRRKSCGTKEVVAIKMLKFDFSKEGFPLEALREIALLSSLRHQNIVRMHAVACGLGEAPMEWHLVMEPAGHELTTLVKGARRRPMTEAQIKHLMLQLLRALAALHSVWVMHRDLKTPNVLVDDKGILRLCDFGLARRVCCGVELEASCATTQNEDCPISSKRKVIFIEPSSIEPSHKCARKNADDEDPCGKKTNEVYATHTPNVISGHYRPPEVLLGCRDYGRSVDLWSAGCIFGELLSRQVLFAGKDEPDQLRVVFDLLGEPSETEWPLYPHLARLRGFHFVPSTQKPLTMAKSGTDLLRRKFPASGFDGTHAPLNAMSLATPLTQITTSLNNTGFSLLSRLLEKCPERRIVAEDAKRDRWFASRPPPEALTVADIMPLLQLAKIQDVASQQVPQFAPTAFSNHVCPPLFMFTQTGNNLVRNPLAAPVARSATQHHGEIAAALAAARARALAFASRPS